MEEVVMTMTDESSQAAATVLAPAIDMKLEIVVIPVADVDRAKSFYASVGWRLDAEFASGDGWRVVQFTPPGSAASVIFGKNVTAATPGSAQGLYLIVSDIEVGRSELIRRGVKISDVFHGGGDVHVGKDEPFLSGGIRVTGPDPKRRSYRSFFSFSDPDGNGWLFQEIARAITRACHGRHDFHLVVGPCWRITACSGGAWRT
jgi:catechol 2,3-dioxygenase-like lactoylglutathione lyase family enzyme